MSVQARAVAVAGLWALCGTIGAAAAAEPVKLTCAPSSLYQCEAMFECLRVPSEAINFPDFFIADLANKTITGRRPDGTDLKTTIERQTRDGNALVLQGIEAGRGWSMSLDAPSGKLSFSVAGPAIGFVGLGACLIE
ncbi:MAG TPA: hypothetical protein PJ986_18730 [Gammaproteobacteria bacterium]|nr:hypothetical protein [Gammaproteobacteria bacterium]